MRHPVKKIRAFARGVLWLALGLACISPALAQGDVAGLARDVEHAEGIRAAKNLQYAYAQYGQAGLWSEIGKLFAAKGEAVFGRDGVKGPAAIARYLRGRYGDGKDGVSKGGLHVQFQLAPIVNLSADGKTAQGRWHELALLGAGPGDAHWAGGILEITYVKENGVWKIARLEYHPMFAGSYADGWRNVEADLKIVPYHYTAQSAGIPVPPLVDAPLPGKAREADVLARIAALNDEDKVRNLQNAYGYYVDRKMWSDITDLFTADGVLEIAGQGIYENPAGIARALEIAGPQGLAHGEINDHLQLDEQVQIKGNEARIRGLEFGMLGMNHARGYLSVTVFENRFVKQDGVWRIREMRLFPNMKTDYAQGWGLSRIVDGPAPSPHAPDRSAPEIDTPDSSPRFFLPNPVTGKAVAFAVGTKVSAKSDLLAAISALAKPDFTLADAAAHLRQSVGYDAVENLSGAIGNWIDDFQWPMLGDLFTANGARKLPSVGSYIGPARIAQAELAENGPPRSPRTNIPVHMRTQPVIDVSPDGRTAKIRSRLFQLGSSITQPGSFSTAGIYEDRAALVDGVWKFTDVQIDHIWRSPGYKRGWTDVPENFGVRPPSKMLTSFPPDLPIKGSTFAPFPAVGPNWFHYKNPVSGRTPPDYWGD